MLKSTYNQLSNLVLNAYSKKLKEKHNYAYASDMKERYKGVSFFINGWQVVCMESEVPAKEVVSKNIMGRDIVIWKNSNNEVTVQSATCPHFGVHLGSGGKVKKDKIICPFHHRGFNKSGACSMKKQNPLYTYPIDINGGIVFAWFHSSFAEPSWALPRLETDYLGNKWKIQHNKMQGVNVPAHPIEFIENGVDFSHAIKLHGLCHEDTKMHEDKETLSIRLKRGRKEKGNININAYGPFVIDYNINFHWKWPVNHRFLVLLQMMSDGSFTAHRVKMKEVNRPNSISEHLFRKGVFIFNEIKVFKTFMQEDHLIMLNRKFLHEPDYDEDDIYSQDFRKWYSQFYPSDKVVKIPELSKEKLKKAA